MWGSTQIWTWTDVPIDGSTATHMGNLNPSKALFCTDSTQLLWGGWQTWVVFLALFWLWRRSLIRNWNSPKVTNSLSQQTSCPSGIEHLFLNSRCAVRQGVQNIYQEPSSLFPVKVSKMLTSARKWAPCRGAVHHWLYYGWWILPVMLPSTHTLIKTAVAGMVMAT